MSQSEFFLLLICCFVIEKNIYASINIKTTKTFVIPFESSSFTLCACACVWVKTALFMRYF